MQSQHPYRSFGRNPQEELEKFTVQISHIGEEAALGTGILVTNDGLIATCYHVIKSIIKSRSAGSSDKKKYVSVSFSDGAVKLEAEISEQYCKENLDVAILKIDKVPEGYEEAKLGTRINDYLGHRFVSRGFRKNERYSHLPSNGTISDLVYSKEWSSEVIRLESSNYGETGMSGSAVYDVDLNQGLVVGMMRFHDEDEKGVDDKAPYAIPALDMIRCCPEIEKKNRGLLVYEFLNMIESFDYQSYKDIDHLWVAPREYDEIIQTLERDRAVIITGPPEYGKTYAAIRILWEYYHKGYISKFVEIEDTALEKAGFKKVLNEFLNIASQRKDIIVYLNDPFGKKTFVKDYVEEVKDLLGKLKVYKNARLIITSRESNYRPIKDDPVFKDLSEGDDKSVVRLDMSSPSYDSTKREMILRLHAKNSGSAWIEDSEKASAVISLLKENDKYLPTLLNILNFVQQTLDEKGEDVDKLKKKMKGLSEGTPKAFAKEINAEHYDLMEFLSFPFISDWFETAFVRLQYEELMEDKTNSKNYSFDQIAEIFKDKISAEKYLRFRHPSYSEALSFLLEIKYYTAEDRQKPSPVIEGFTKVILKLADNAQAAEIVAHAVAYDLIKLPRDVRDELLIKLAQNKRVSDIVARAVVFNPDKISEDTRDKVLLEAADDEGASRIVAYAVASKFDNLREDVRNELLRRLFHNRGVVDDKRASSDLDDAISSNKLKLPEEIMRLYNVWKPLFYLPNDKGEAKGLVQDIHDNYTLDNVPQSVRNEALLKAANDRKTAQIAACYINDHFHQVDEVVRNEVLLKTAKYEETAKIVAETAIYNFKEVDYEVKNLLFRLDYNEDQAYDVAGALALSFHNLSPDVRNELLRKLVNRNKARELLSEKLAPQYLELPSDIRNKLLKK